MGHLIHENSLKNLIPFPKGRSGNPKGRPKKIRYEKGKNPNSLANLLPWTPGQSGNPKGRKRTSSYARKRIKKGIIPKPKGGNPPKEYQFKKGESGNPKGRPKGSGKKKGLRDIDFFLIAFEVAFKGSKNQRKIQLTEDWLQKQKPFFDLARPN